MKSSEKILIDKKWAWKKRHHDREKSPFENKSWVGESEKVGLDLENITWSLKVLRSFENNQS